MVHAVKFLILDRHVMHFMALITMADRTMEQIEQNSKHVGDIKYIYKIPF